MTRKPQQNPNPHLKTIAIVAGIIGTLIGMYYNQKRRDVPGYEQPSRTGETRRPRPESTRPEPDALPERGAASRASAGSRADYDFYLLAMSLHDAFCADGHMGKPECRAQSPRPLVIHGLWPEKLEPRAYPRDCAAPPLDLEPALARELAAYMPGMRSGLHQHEWRTHGSCSGLGDDEYFRAALDRARQLEAALAPYLTTHAGREVSAADFRAAIDADAPSWSSATLTFHCRTLRDAPRRGDPYLVEVRQCLEAAHPGPEPGAPFACEIGKRRDQGCGARFRILGAAR